MKRHAKTVRAAEMLAIVITVVMFFTMLCTCGMYIDIKINGQSSSLPPVPSHEKQILLKTGAAENKLYPEDMIEPLIIGIKDGNKQICASFDSESRASLKNITDGYLDELFSGTSKKISFKDDAQRMDYVEKLISSPKYVLLSYFGEIHASAFPPCLSQSFESPGSDMLFGVKHLFITNGEDGTAFGVSVSQNGEINELYPSRNFTIDNISADEYDISEGYSRFEYFGEDGIHPVYSTSFLSDKYELRTMGSIYGKSMSSYWVDNLFDIFSLNSSLVKSFSSKNDTEIIYVDDENELLLNDDGKVEYVSDGEGINLEHFLGYAPNETGSYMFTDKILAVKNIVNSIKHNKDSREYSVVGIDYEKHGDLLSVYLKSFVDGIAVFDSNYDAVFEITSDSLTRASFVHLVCTRIDEYCVCLNQSYSNVLLADAEQENLSDVTFCPVLEKEEDGDYYVPVWAKFDVYDSEVQ